MPGSVELFKRYPNRMFIETGSAYGDGIQQALDAGFENVISIETSKEFYDHCVERFKGDYRVVLVHGDSREELKHVPEIPFPITFWLDGHNEDDYPLLAELQAIGLSDIKTHTILIDDLRMLDIVKHGLSIKVLTEKMLEINPNYQFCFENGHVANDILVAKI
jgi:hypothetical protein